MSLESGLPSNMKVSIKLKNAEQIKSFLQSRPQETKHQLGLAIAKTVKAVEAETKRRTPVDTGRLRTSIQAREFPSALEGEVGTTVIYAIIQHESIHFRHRVGEARFMSNAVRHLNRNIQQFFIQAMENVIK